MSDVQTCPRCGGGVRTQQVDNLRAKYCDHCGSLPFAINARTGKRVTVDRAGHPTARERLA